MWSNTPDSAAPPAADGEASTRLLLWQPDGRAAAVVSSTSLDLLNVESGADIFRASLSNLDGCDHLVDGVWVQLAAAADGPSTGPEDRELHFTDFLPPIPRFSEGGGGSNGDDHDDEADAATSDLPLASSSSKPPLSLIALLDARGHSR